MDRQETLTREFLRGKVSRRDLYREIQFIMRDEGSTVTPIFTNWLDAYASRVQDLKGHPHGFGGWIYWEDVWIDDSVA